MLRNTPFNLGKVDTYVFSVVFKPMRSIFIFVLVILECVRFRQGLGLAMHQDNFAALLFTYLSQWLALYAGLAMQMALAVGVMLGLARLAQNREMDAMHALGFGLHRLMAMPSLLATLVVLVDFVILGWLQPLSVYNSANFAHQVQRFVSLLPEGGDFFYSSAGKTVLIDGIAPKSNEFGKIFVYETYPDGKTVATGGSKGRIAIINDDPKQYYDVGNVRMMQVAVGGDANGKVLPQSYNTSSTAQLKGPVSAVDTSSFRQRGSSEWELTFAELINPSSATLATVPQQALSAEFSYRVVQLLFIFLLPFIAALFVVEPRRNPGPFRFLVGLLTILGFHQLLGIAASFSRRGELPVILSLWLPLALLAAVVIWRFHGLATRPAFQTAR